MMSRTVHPLPARDRPMSIARLHAEACYRCGTVTKQLVADNSIVVAGTARSWPIVNCGRHKEAVR
jgi:hypothetical protein